ncbi:MAG: T9SS type A sorting domain-containing protein [Bacteroidetes bacterium]|nr:T9SS type A sorting domain-containing protein [Bacteroidota bacterium]
MDAIGNIVWVREWDYVLTKLAVDSAGSVFVTRGDTLRKYTTNGAVSWSEPMLGINIDVEGNKLIVASDSVITMVTKSNGALVGSITVPDCEAVSITKAGEIYYTGAAGTGKLLNMNPVWFLSGLNGVSIDASATGVWIGKVIFESPDFNDSSLIALIDPMGNINYVDTMYKSRIMKVCNGYNNQPLIFSQFDFITIANDGFISAALFKPYIVYWDSYGVGFVLGKYNTQSIPKLGFSVPFWNTVNGWLGYWEGTKKCPGGAPFDISYKVYDTSFTPGNIIFIELSDVNGSFSQPTVIGALGTTNAQGQINCQLPSGLTNSPNYVIRIRSTSPVLSGAQTSINLQISAPLVPIALSGTGNTFCAKAESLSVVPGSYSQQWQKNGTNIIGAISTSYLPTTNGTYKCILTDDYGCSRASTNQITVNVLPLPSATITPTGSQEICKNDSVVVSVPANVNNTYQWYKGNILLSGQTANLYTAKSAGNYKAIVTGANGCTKTSSTYKLSVYKSTASAFGPTTFCAGGSVVLGSSNNGSISWLWKLNNVNIPGAVAQFYAATQAGTYKVLTTNANGCTSVTNAINVVVNCREGDETDLNNDLINYQLYPNPANEVVNIIWESTFEERVEISCIDVLGKTVIAQGVQVGNGDQNYKLNCSNLAAGVYIVRVSVADGVVVSKRLVVTK